MSRIEINGGGHQVVVDHDGHDLAYVVEKAQKLWQDTKELQPPPGPAYGFTSQVDTQWNHDRQQGSQWRPVRAHGGGPA